jgi:hypothetical protein
MTTHEIARRLNRLLTPKGQPTPIAGAKVRGACLRVWTTATDSRTLPKQAARALLDTMEARA